MAITETYGIDKDWGTLTNPLLHELENKNGLSGTDIDTLRSMALRQFKQLGVPGRKHEDWKYTPLRSLLKTAFIAAKADVIGGKEIGAIAPALDAACIVCINGRYSKEHSDPLPEGVWLGTGSDVLEHEEASLALEQLIARLNDVTMTPFEALASSIVAPGICLYTEKNRQADRPIHFLHLATSETGPSMRNVYKFIIADDNASVEIVETFVTVGDTQVGFTNSVNHILVGSGAQCNLYRLQNENKAGYHINMTRTFQEKDSTFSSMAAELGSKLMRNNIEVSHRGTNITSNLYGVFMASDQQHTDTQSFIDHAQPHCVSNEMYKGILDDFARGVFNGKIIVRPNAQKTNAFQQNSTLILSRNAIMDSKPQLEIFADDVKCSHGATIGQLDEDAIFYLRSRGLSRPEASGLLQQAFVGEVIDKCGNAAIKSYFHNAIESRGHE